MALGKFCPFDSFFSAKLAAFSAAILPALPILV
jgi:hypothetical protein